MLLLLVTVPSLQVRQKLVLAVENGDEPRSPSFPVLLDRICFGLAKKTYDTRLS